MKQVKFFNTGRWAEHKPHLPQIEVKEGQVLSIPDDVSPETAAIAVGANRAEYVEETADKALELAKTLGKNKHSGKKNR